MREIFFFRSPRASTFPSSAFKLTDDVFFVGVCAQCLCKNT